MGHTNLLNIDWSCETCLSFCIVVMAVCLVCLDRTTCGGRPPYLCRTTVVSELTGKIGHEQDLWLAYESHTHALTRFGSRQVPELSSFDGENTFTQEC